MSRLAPLAYVLLLLSCAGESPPAAQSDPVLANGDRVVFTVLHEPGDRQQGVVGTVEECLAVFRIDTLSSSRRRAVRIPFPSLEHLSVLVEHELNREGAQGREVLVDLDSLQIELGNCWARSVPGGESEGYG
jgi:hypothetical protein